LNLAVRTCGIQPSFFCEEDSKLVYAEVGSGSYSFEGHALGDKLEGYLLGRGPIAVFKTFLEDLVAPDPEIFCQHRLILPGLQFR